jgi:hypothetical protein
MRQNVCISLNRAIIDHIDSSRGDVPRSRVVESLISRGIDFDKTVKALENECSGVEQAPTSQPAALSGTTRRSKGQS